MRKGKRHRDRWSKGELEIMVERLAIWMYENDGGEWYRDPKPATRTVYLRHAKHGVETMLGVEIEQEF